MQLRCNCLQYCGNIIPKIMNTLLGSITAIVVSLTLNFSCRYWLILTNSMLPNHSWETNNRAATEEFPIILRTPKCHCRVHKSPTLVLVQNKVNPIYITSSHTLGSILILFFHIRLGLPNGFFPSGLSTKIFYGSLFSPTCATFPAQHILVYLIILIV
jgi:hypothetical protein